ncbi:MAG: sigma-70 family RNA polymerase sigma factor [Deltaproteobacteria bacterium]|nr:sigma-70 family RNA polymerase sigma factor [Deltaproteobacteria bacterium]
MKSAESEIWLARRASAGHAADERAVLELTGPVMLRVIKRVLGAQADELEDVLQEASLGLLSSLRGFRGECTLRHYAGRIAARHAIRARRRREREREKVVALREWAEARAHGGAASTRVHEQREDERLFRELLSKLPEEQAEALVLRVVLGHSLPEIAEAVGAPTNTVRSRIRLARERLRQMLVRRGVGT